MTTAWLLGLVLSSQGSLPATPVTFSNPGQPLHGLLPLLSKEAGVELTAAPVMLNEVLVLHAEAVPIDQVLLRIARVTEGTWSRSGEGWTLVPDNNARELARRQLRADRIKKLREEIARQLKPVEKEAEGDMFGMAFGGSNRHVAQIVSGLDLNTLVGIPQGGRLVFSSNPTRMQRSFTPNPAVIQAIVAEHNKLAGSSEGPPDTGAGMDEEMQAMMRRMGMNRRMTPIKAPPAKVILAVQQGGMLGDDALQAQLKLYDQEGKVLLIETTSFLSSMEAQLTAAREAATKPDAKPAEKDDSPKLELTSLGKEFSKLTRGMEQAFMGTPLQMSAEIKAAVSRPTQFEPLGYLLGEYLVQAAKHRKQTLVANLPDASLELSDIVKETTTVNQLMTRLETFDGLTIKAEGGYLTLAPSDGDRSREERTPRAPLERLLAAAKNGSVPLLALAEYAANSPRVGLRSPIAMLAAVLTAPSLFKVAFEPKSWDALALYGLLTPIQRQALEEGRQLPFMSLTPAQLARAHQMTYGADPQIRVGEAVSEDGLGGMFGMMMRGMFSSGDDADFRNEPTEVAPAGLVAPGFIHAKTTMDYIFSPVGNNPLSMMMGMVGAEELAMYSMMRDSDPSMSAFLPDFREFQLGRRKIIDLRVQLTAEASAGAALNDDEMPENSPKYTLETVPDDVKARIESAREKMKKSGLPFGDPGVFRRGVPPPSR